MQQNFAEIGFEVDLEEFPDTEHNTRRAVGEFTLATQGLGGAFDPDVLHGPTTATADGTSASSRTPRSTRCWSRDAPPSVPRTVCRSTTRSRPSCSKSTIPRSTGVGAGRSSDTVPGSRATARPTAAPPPPIGCTGRGSRASPACRGNLTPCVGTSPPNPLSIWTMERGNVAAAGVGAPLVGARTPPGRAPGRATTRVAPTTANAARRCRHALRGNLPPSPSGRWRGGTRGEVLTRRRGASRGSR